MKHSRILLVVLMGSVLFQSCATPYAGRMPDLSLRGDKAEKEYGEFKFRETFWHQSSRDYQMGSAQTSYTIESLRPLISQVSPLANSKVATADYWTTAQNVFLGVGLASLVGFFAAGQESTKSAFALGVYGGSLSSIACGFVSFFQYSQAATLYNNDLRAKLEVKVAEF